MRFTLSALALATSFGFALADDTKKADEPKKADTKKEEATPEQQFKDLQKAYTDAIKTYQTAMQAAKPDEQKKIDDAANADLGAILTDDQKAKLKEMGGKPFARKDPPRGGGGL